MTVKSTESKITNRTRSRGRVVAEAICAACLPLYPLFYWSNNAIAVSRYQFVDPRVPQSLDGLKIVQVSDLHGKIFGRDSKRLFDKIRAAEPDLIAITGDLIDERKYDLDYVRDVVERLVAIAPAFYTSGNHEQDFVDEYRRGAFDAIERAGATTLDDRCVELTRDPGAKLTARPRAPGSEPTPDSILLVGIADPQRVRDQRGAIDASLRRFPITDAQPVVALSHRPEALDVYARRGVDLAFCGHAHGGQIRVPFLVPNGLYAPHQGLFPQYTGGLYRLGGTTEIASRGLGASVAPTRLFNRPELVICELKRAVER